jgi:hypothetical protein
MAPSVQMFPSITISKNEHPSNFYSKTTRWREKKRQISTPVSAFSAIVGVSLKCVL